MNLNEFYNSNNFSLEKITDTQWRQFRFFLPNSRFFKVPDTIRDSRVLKSWVLKKQPLDIYYSVARFLSPQTVGPASEKISDNLFLGADLAFDIDKQPFRVRNIEKARIQTLNLIGFLQEQKIPVKYIAFSGSKGFHVLCEDKFDYGECTPLQREKKAKQLRKTLCEQILAKGIEIDSKVTVDTRRIIRLPGTINSKTGLECRLLSLEELFLPARQIINNSQKVSISACTIRKEMTGNFQFARKIRGPEPTASKVLPQFVYCSFLSSKVSGTKLHVPIIVFNSKNLQKAADCIQLLQQEYGLDDFFLFKGKELFAIGLNALQPERINKILKKAYSKNRHFFKKFVPAFVQISPTIGEKLNQVQKAPEFLKTIQSANIAKKPVSSGHIKFLSDCQINFKESGFAVGKKEYSLSHCLVEN